MEDFENLSLRKAREKADEKAKKIDEGTSQKQTSKWASKLDCFVRRSAEIMVLWITLVSKNCQNKVAVKDV